MKLVKNLLFSLLGQKRYLIFISRSFITLYRTGLLRMFRKFDTHYMAQKLTSPGDTVIDIGANVGYYSTIFARKVGISGSVRCVEPVKYYREILEINTRKFSNIDILPYALGDRNAMIYMAIPDNDKTRHGLTRVMGENEMVNHESGWEAEMRRSDEIFKDIVPVSYIKIDIEGFEDRVLPGLAGLIETNKPVIQIEVAPENRSSINSMLKSYGYSSYQARGKRLVSISGESKITNDIIYIPKELFLKFKNIIDQ